MRNENVYELCDWLVLVEVFTINFTNRIFHLKMAFSSLEWHTVLFFNLSLLLLILMKPLWDTCFLGCFGVPVAFEWLFGLHSTFILSKHSK